MASYPKLNLSSQSNYSAKPPETQSPIPHQNQTLWICGLKTQFIYRHCQAQDQLDLRLETCAAHLLIFILKIVHICTKASQLFCIKCHKQCTLTYKLNPPIWDTIYDKYNLESTELVLVPWYTGLCPYKCVISDFIKYLKIKSSLNLTRPYYPWFHTYSSSDYLESKCSHCTELT